MGRWVDENGSAATKKADHRGFLTSCPKRKIRNETQEMREERRGGGGVVWGKK